MKRSPAKKLLGYAEIERLVSYTPDTGALTYKHVLATNKYDRRHNNLLAGRQIETKSKDGYIPFRIQIGGVKLYTLAHQVAYLLMEGRWLDDRFEIDHINNDRSDNRWSNLRFVERSSNGKNRKMSVRNKTGFKGVYPHQSKSGRWVAMITSDYRQYYLGDFESPEDAARAYDRAAERLHGEYAKTNAELTTLN